MALKLNMSISRFHSFLVTYICSPLMLLSFIHFSAPSFELLFPSHIYRKRKGLSFNASTLSRIVSMPCLHGPQPIPQKSRNRMLPPYGLMILSKSAFFSPVKLNLLLLSTRLTSRSEEHTSEL